MDWNKLQHTLYNLDPTDRRDDIAKLTQVAQSGAPTVAPTKDYVTESVNVPQGSMPLGIDSISDFAALAGIVTEGKQKDADQVRAKGPMPKAEPGRTKHPFQDKLVGEEEIDEVGATDFVKGRFKQGYNNANNPAALKNPDGSSKQAAAKKEPTRITGGMSGQRIASELGVTEPQQFANGYNKIKSGRPINRNEQMALGAGFAQLMKMDDVSLRKMMNQLVQLRQESAVPAKRTESIKEELYRKLNAGK